jgi:PAS domain S-box-containing protein
MGEFQPSGRAAISEPDEPLSDESRRLQALESYDILHTPREQDFDDIAELAAEICRTPIAVVNFIGDGRQFLKAEVGLGERGIKLESAFCHQAILQGEVLAVTDATKDPRFADDPFVSAAPSLRFYAGAPLRTADGLAIGTVCVLDTRPRRLTERQQAGLQRLARQTMTQLELRRAGRIQQAEKALQNRVLESASDYAIVATDRTGRVTRWNAGAERILGWREDEMLGSPAHRFFTPEDRAGSRPEIEMGLALENGSAPGERWHLRKTGERFWARGEMMPLKTASGEVRGFMKILRDRTQQRVDAAERNASELRFQSLVEVSPQVVWFGDATGHITYCNSTWYEFTGLTPADTSDDSWTSVIHPDHRVRILDVWKQAIATGDHYEIEIPFRRASDGQYRWFLARGRPVRDAAGLVGSWIGIAIDIHERKQAEADLRKTREQLRLAIAATGTGVFDYDLGTGALEWDDRTRALFGLPPDVPVSYDVFLKGLHPEDRARVEEAVKTALDPAGDGSYDIAYRTIGLSDGVERWLAARGQAYFDQGRAVRFIGTVLDTTDSRRAEQELRETEERYRLAARATNDGIWDWDLGTDHVRWNEAVQTLFGYAPDAIAQNSHWWKTHIHSDDRERVEAGISAVIHGGIDHWSAEYRFLRADGSYGDILDRGYVLRDAEGKPVRMIGAMLDMTERKRAEEHQRLLTGELQHRVKNTLALVQAVASQTLRGATDLATARASAALSISLALHELATNAAKYGALSNESGVVDLRWDVVHDEAAPLFYLTWSEQDGPPIVGQPTRRGFGSRLIERSFTTEVGGEVELTYAPTGLVCRLEAPLASIAISQGTVCLS